MKGLFALGHGYTVAREQEGGAALLNPEGVVIAGLKAEEAEALPAGHWPAWWVTTEEGRAALRSATGPMCTVVERAISIEGVTFRGPVTPAGGWGDAGPRALRDTGSPTRTRLYRRQRVLGGCDAPQCGGETYWAWMPTGEPGPLVVTRHPALVMVLERRGVIPPGAEVVAHATPDLVRGRTVIGVLPFHLAVLASTVTTVDLDLRPEQRGRELSAEEVEEALGGVSTYAVDRADFARVF